MKTLIISNNAIGDTYISLSAIKYVRNSIGGEVHICYKLDSALLGDRLESEKVYILKSKNVFQVFITLLKIRKIKYDYSFSFFPGKLNNLMLLMSRSKKKYDYRLIGGNTDWHSATSVVFCNRKIRNIFKWTREMNFQDRIKIIFLASGLDFQNIEKYRIAINSQNQKNGFVIHFNSREVKKSLSIKCLQELTDFLAEKYFEKITVIGNSYDLGLLNEFVNKNISFFNAKKLSELVSLIIESKLFIGVDSFPLHVSDAHYANFIGLFSITDPKSVLINHQNGILFGSESLHNVTASEIIPHIEKCYLIHE